MCKIINLLSIKGGIAKTTTSVNLGVALANMRKKVLVIDNDPQFNLTTALNVVPSEVKLPNLYMGVIDDLPEAQLLNHIESSIISKNEYLDIIPSDLSMSALETILPSAMNREYILKSILEPIQDRYDFIIVDNLPSLGLFSINALTACNSVIIPVEAHFLGTEGLRLILETISKVKKRLNKELTIEGVLITKYQSRTNCCKQVRAYVEDLYGGSVNIYSEPINYSIKVAESAACGVSVIEYDPRGQPAKAYTKLAEEVLKNVCTEA
jgi:chromosome partitioning protein